MSRKVFLESLLAPILAAPFAALSVGNAPIQHEPFRVRDDRFPSRLEIFDYLISQFKAVYGPESCGPESYEYQLAQLWSLQATDAVQALWAVYSAFPEWSAGINHKRLRELVGGSSPTPLLPLASRAGSCDQTPS